MRQDIELRLEKPQDYTEVEHITREAFWNKHVPGCDEHYLAHVLRSSAAFVPELDFVAVHDGKVVGNIMYTKAVIRCDDGTEQNVLSFGPISVLPLMQGQGVGSMLIRHTLENAKEMGYTAVLIYGDPGYYSRFGFVSAKQYGIGTSDDFYAEALQALELVPDALAKSAGKFFEDHAYEIDETAAAAFDKQFLPKALRDDLPSQRHFKEMLKARKPRTIG
jgi:predicted N-acetyltransferase YhbS